MEESMGIEDLVNKHVQVQAKYDRDLYQALWEQGLTPEQLAQKQKEKEERGWKIFERVMKGLTRIKVSEKDTYKTFTLPHFPKNSYDHVLVAQFSIYHDGRVYCECSRVGRDFGAVRVRKGGDHDTTKKEFLSRYLLVEVFGYEDIEQIIMDVLNEQEWFLAKAFPLLEKEIEKDKTKPLLLAAPAPSPQLRTELIEDPATGQQIEVTWWGEEPPKLGRIIDPQSAVDLYAELAQARANMHIQNLKGLNIQHDLAAAQYLSHILDSAWTNAYSSGPKYESPFDFEKFSGDTTEPPIDGKRKWWQFWKK
jgi:hypothetical protein